MTLRLPEHWIWDFWFAQDGDDVHVFYLQAPRSLGDPELRHHNASVGHAVSRDLPRGRCFPTRSGPASRVSSTIATWTGSVLRHGGRWHLAYTGASQAENGMVQRIGLASSDDLVAWRKHGMVSEADPRWYRRTARASCTGATIADMGRRRASTSTCRSPRAPTAAPRTREA